MHTQHPSVAPGDFTQALSLAASGVNIVTTDGEGGRAGLTVSSMCSVCAEPPVVLVCVASENEFCNAAQTNGNLVVNLLSDKQTEIAKTFAGLSDNPDEDRFNSGSWHTQITGSPVLQDALVSLDCQISASHSHGTHTIYICRVVGVASEKQDALIYCMRQFGTTKAI